MHPTSAVLFARLMAGARFRHLQAFAAIAELGSAKRAADTIGLTQPAVTHLVADLEELLQCELFHRHARGMRMTDTARELLPFVERALSSLESGAQHVALRHGNAQRVVRVGAIEGAISGLLVHALPAFGRRRPDILVQLQEADAPQSAHLVAAGEIDLLLCREPPVCPQGWEFTEALPDCLVVVAAVGHPLLTQRALRMESLLEQTWLMLHPGTQSRKIFDALMAQYGASPRYSPLEVRSVAMALAQLRSEPLLSLAPYSVMRQLIELGLLARLDVLDLPDFAPLGILSRCEDTSGASCTLKEHLLAHAKTQSMQWAPSAQQAQSARV